MADQEYTEYAGIPLVLPSVVEVMGTPLYLFSDDGNVRVEQRRIQVYTMWVRGYPIHLICRELGHDYATVRRDIEIIQAFLRVVKRKDMDEAADRSIAHLREVQGQCYTLMARPENLKQLSALLNTIVRCEEQIARIEGIIIQKSFQKTDSEQRIKLYDFRDVLPPAKPLSSGQSVM